MPFLSLAPLSKIKVLPQDLSSYCFLTQDWLDFLPYPLSFILSNQLAFELKNSPQPFFYMFTFITQSSASSNSFLFRCRAPLRAEIFLIQIPSLPFQNPSLNQKSFFYWAQWPPHILSLNLISPPNLRALITNLQEFFATSKSFYWSFTVQSNLLDFQFLLRTLSIKLWDLHSLALSL